MSNHDQPASPDAAEADVPYVIVPSDQLSAGAFESLLEEYITREGTEYGPREYSLDEKKQQLKRALLRGEIVIVFETESESVTLRSRDELRAR